MNRFTTAVVVFLLVAGLAISAPAQTSKSRLHKILSTGVLRVGTTGDFNPMSMRDPATNTYTGYDIDVARELAKDMGVEIKFVATDWKSIVNGIVADKYDISTSASITVKRIPTVGFSEWYFQVGTVPLCLKKNVDRFAGGWESINQPDVKVAVTLGTSQEQQVKRFFPNAKVRTIEAPARDFQEVLAGRADISVTSNLEASTLVKTYPQMTVVPVSEPRAPADLAFMADQDDIVWINFLNHWVKIKKSHGFFEQLKQKWM
jgi:cyclohexadienyl dehydratase